MKKVLVACEYSQVVTKAFREAGASAWSCDIVPCLGGHPEWHFQTDVLRLLHQSWSWDLVIAHPPCTYLTKTSAVALSRDASRYAKMGEAREFFMEFTRLGVPTCIENPIPLRCALLPPYSQIICPSDFGHEFTKRTCLWLYDLPPLLPTHYHNWKAESWLLHCSNRSRRRARFWEGIAKAMAEQWLPLV